MAPEIFCCNAEHITAENIILLTHWHSFVCFIVAPMSCTFIFVNIYQISHGISIFQQTVHTLLNTFLRSTTLDQVNRLGTLLFATKHWLRLKQWAIEQLFGCHGHGHGMYSTSSIGLNGDPAVW